MDKITIIKSLDENVIQFNELVKNLNKDEFEININATLPKIVPKINPTTQSNKLSIIISFKSKTIR